MTLTFLSRGHFRRTPMAPSRLAGRLALFLVAALSIVEIALLVFGRGALSYVVLLCLALPAALVVIRPKSNAVPARGPQWKDGSHSARSLPPMKADEGYMAAVRHEKTMPVPFGPR